MSSSDKDAEQQELSYIHAWNAKSYTTFGKQISSFLQS